MPVANPAIVTAPLSSATAGGFPARVSNVGSSLTGVTVTWTGIGVADSRPASYRATTVNALNVPLASGPPVQYAEWAASMVSLVPGAKAVAVGALAPISSVPLVTASTTN